MFSSLLKKIQSVVWKTFETQLRLHAYKILKSESAGKSGRLDLL